MNPKQDRSKALIRAKIGKINIYAGFNVNTRNKVSLAPHDRLARFLSTDNQSEEEVIQFCEDYKYIPRDYPRLDLLSTFSKDQEEVLNFKSGFTNNSLSQKDLDLANYYLSQISQKLGFLNDKEIQKTNKALVGDKKLYQDRNSEYLSISKLHHGALPSMWEDLIKQLIQSQDLRECSNCGCYFRLERRDKRRKYCNDDCRDKYNKKRRYHENKKSK